MANDSEVFMKALDKIARYDDIFGLDDKTEITAAIHKHLLTKEHVSPVTRRITLKANVPSYVAKAKARYKELDAAAKTLNRPADFVDTFVTSLGGFSGEIPAPSPDDFGWAYHYSLNGIEGTIRRKDGLYTIVINKIGLILLTATGIEPERGDDDMPRDWREREESATTTANIATYMVPLGKPMRRTPLRFKGEVGDCDCDDEDDECNCEDNVEVDMFPESFEARVAKLTEGKSKGRTLSRARRHIMGGTKAGQDEKKRAKRERRSDERRKLKSFSGKKTSDVGDVEFKKVRLDPRNVS